MDSQARFSVLFKPFLSAGDKANTGYQRRSTSLRGCEQVPCASGIKRVELNFKQHSLSLHSKADLDKTSFCTPFQKKLGRQTLFKYINGMTYCDCHCLWIQYLRGSSNHLELIVTARIWTLLSTFLSNYETVNTKNPNTSTVILKSGKIHTIFCPLWNTDHPIYLKIVVVKLWIKLRTRLQCEAKSHYFEYPALRPTASTLFLTLKWTTNIKVSNSFSFWRVITYPH